MDMDLFEKNLVEIFMIKYLGNIIDTFPEEIKLTQVTPAMGRIFQVIDKSKAKFFPEEQDVAFNHTVAQLSFM